MIPNHFNYIPISKKVLIMIEKKKIPHSKKRQPTVLAKSWSRSWHHRVESQTRTARGGASGSQARPTLCRPRSPPARPPVWTSSPSYSQTLSSHTTGPPHPHYSNATDTLLESDSSTVYSAHHNCLRPYRQDSTRALTGAKINALDMYRYRKQFPISRRVNSPAAGRMYKSVYPLPISVTIGILSALKFNWKEGTC